MESTQELQHWGIKGQRWGVRRYQNPDGTLTEAGKKRYYYQNPDGSLTEAGKKDYMKAAKKGKLDVSKLSDNDLNMINSRFAREKTFKQNVSDYEKSTFKYRLKEAALARIKGSGGGGGGGGKGKGGGSGIAKMFAMPIKKAFEEAFKDSPSGGGKDDGDEFDFEAVKQYREYTKNGHIWKKGFAWSKADNKNRKRWEKEGKRFVDDSTKNWNAESEDYGKNRSSGSRSSEDILRSRYKPMPQKQQQKGQRTKELEREKRLEERLSKSGLVLGHSEIRFIVHRSDELYHWGIKGQKWGVRRFENKDGTLTPEGKARYGAAKTFDRNAKNGKFTNDPELRDIYIMEAEDKLSKSDDKHPDLDYRNSEAVGEYVFNLHQKYHDAARNDAVWRKHGLGQDTVGQFVEQKKYGDMVNHIDSAVKESREAAIKAADAATKSRENARKPGPLWENMNRKSVEYWDKFQQTADDYIKNNFSNADQEVARGVIYWWYIDW